MTTEIQTVTPETLPAIMWQNQPVITTELLAQIYDTDTDNISQNFIRNISRFTEGVHYHLLKGSDLRDFKANLLKEGQLIINKFAKSLYLWTERGTVRHAKILDTDNAWAVQDRLEDFYFQKHQSTPSTLLLESQPITKTQYGVLSSIISDIATSSGKEGTTKVALWSRFSTHFKLSSSKDLPASKFDDAKSYLESKKSEYDRGFTLAVVKKDDLLSLGYDNETKMFAVRALEQPQRKTTWNGNGHVSMILGVEGKQRLVVEEHNDMTVIMKLNDDDFVGTFETVVRELKLRGYVVMKKDDLADKLSVLVA